MKRIITILVLTLLTLGMTGMAVADWEDRFSGISLKSAPTNYADFPEISAPSGNPASNRGWLYVKDKAGVSALYFEDDAGTVTDLTIAAAVTLDGAYTNGQTITLDASGDMVIRTDPDTNPNQLVFDTVTGVGALADMIIVQTTSGTITDFIDCTDAGVTNCLNIGGNSIVGTGGIINFNEFDVSGTTGSVTINDGGDAGNISIEGTVLDINSLDFVGAGSITTAVNTALTLNVAGGDAAGEDLIITAHNLQLTATGAMTFSPDAAVTTAITCSDTDLTNCLDLGASDIIGTTPIINFTNFDVDASGNTTIGGTLTVTGATSLGTLKQDNLVPASASPQAITLNGGGTGKVQIANTSTGNIELGGGATNVDLIAGTDLTISEGKATMTSTANEDMITVTNNTSTDKSGLTITQGATTTGKAISVVANGLTTGDLLYLETSDAGFTSGNYIRAYNGAAAVFTVADEGLTTIKGSAANTDALVLTAGDVLLTAGYLQLSAGKIEVDVATDLGSYFKRNQGVTTVPVVEIETTNAADDQPALLIDHNTTAAAAALKIESQADAYAIDVDVNAANGSGMRFTMANTFVGYAINIDAGAWTGQANLGLIHLATDAAATSEVGQAIRIKLGGTAVDAAAIDGKGLYIEDEAAATAGSYLVKLDSANNGAMHVAAGAVLIDTALTIANTGSLTVNEDITVTLDANDEEIAVTASAADYAANSGITQIYGSAAAGQTNASYLLRLARKADGDAQDRFIQAVDNSTGAAGNGDIKFEVKTGGEVYALGGIAAGNASDSLLKTDTVECSNACIKALRATPLALVAAPGADYFVEMVSIMLILDYGTEVLTESADNLVVQYNTSGTDITAAIEMTGFIDAAADTVALVLPAGIANTAATNAVNRAVELFNTGDGEFAGNATADTTLTIKFTYRTHKAGL